MGIYAMSSGSLGAFYFKTRTTSRSRTRSRATASDDGWRWHDQRVHDRALDRHAAIRRYADHWAGNHGLGRVPERRAQGSGFTISTTVLGLNGITFSTAPGAGVTIGLDMTYYYYCKFSDDTNTFEKFLDQIWQIQSLKFMSCLAFG